MFGPARRKSGPCIVAQALQDGINTIHSLPEVAQFYVPSPAENAIQPSAGDDLTPPNALRDGKYNAICTHAIANVGYSTSDEETNVLPSRVEYAIIVKHDGGLGKVGMNLKLTLEYANPNPGEAMVVWMKKCKQFICDEQNCDQELSLVDTCFQDLVEGGPDGRWVDITTDIRYSDEAEAVAQSVFESDSGQTAGRLRTVGSVEDAKLGPVGTRGRIVLTYSCKSLYTYAQMSMTDAESGRTLAPLVVWLPHAALHDHMGNSTCIDIYLDTPQGARLIDPKEPYNRPAIDHLGTLEHLSKAVILLPQATDNPGPYHWPCLPPVPWCMLFWFSLPTSDWEVLASNAGSVMQVHVPPASISPYLRMSAPGNGPAFELLRATLWTKPMELPQGAVRVLTNMLISDASGSTGLQRHGKTVRDAFNVLAVRRFIKRLESVPLLLQSGALSGSEIWAEAVYVFDHAVCSEFSLMFEVQELAHSDVLKAIVSAAEADCATAARSSAHRQVTDLCAAHGLSSGNVLRLYDEIVGFVDKLRHITPGGATSFVAPAERAVNVHPEFRSIVAKKVGSKTPLYTTYVNFDTDGGNNCGPCYRALERLVDACDVMGGTVTGFGSWVDQDCATRVAHILRGPCMLYMDVPSVGSEGQNAIFRKDINSWIKALRCVPISMTLAAGGVSWQAQRGIRQENALDLVVLKSQIPRHDGTCKEKFGLPDVTALDHTGACVEGLTGGDTYSTYLLSRIPAEQLVKQLKVIVGGVQARVELVPEKEEGIFVALDWLSVLQSPVGQATNKSVLSNRLRQRLEDDLSFLWNLPTPSGSTACLGRAKTTNRPPVSASQQPQEPVLEVALSSQPALFGNPAPASAPLFGGGGLFGAATPPVSAPFGAPSSQAAFGFGAPSSQAAFGFGAPSSQAAFGFGAPGSSGGLGGCFGASQTAAFGFGGGGCFGTAPPTPPKPTSATPSIILRHTGYLQLRYDRSGPNGTLTTEQLLLQSLQILEGKMQMVQKLAMDYFCDSCRTTLGPDKPRYHCLKCVDFDLCETCYAKCSYGPVKHKKEHPTIRVCAGPGTAVSADPEDPVTASLLGTAAPSSASSTTPDMTIVNARAKLQCFVAVLKYWKVVLEPLLADAKRDDVYKNLEHIITVAGQ